MTDTSDIAPSAQLYTPFALKVYDFWVLWLSNTWAWRCPTKSILLPFYERHLASSEHHLDVGAGTGYYPANVLTKSKLKSVTLMDLNPSTLAHAENRIKANGYKGGVEGVIHNAFEKFPEESEMRGKFDSISLYYVLHCLPGKFPSKVEIVARSLADGLTENGVFYGSTILASVPSGQGHNLFGRLLMNFYNKKQIFGNEEDDVAGLKTGLEAVFEEVEIEVVWMVALFTCRRPRKQNTVTSPVLK